MPGIRTRRESHEGSHYPSQIVGQRSKQARRLHDGLSQEAVAERMVSLGWRVFGTSRKPRTSDDGIEWVAMDVCEDASVVSALESVYAQTDHLDGLVCNAGWGIYGSVEETSLDRARAQFETNFFGVLRVLTPVLARMRECNSGRILLLGSLSGRAPIPFQAELAQAYSPN